MIDMPEDELVKGSSDVKKDKVRQFGFPIAAGFIYFFAIMLLIVNIPPIPLPFTSVKFILVNQVFAELLKFYSYVVLYVVLIYIVFTFLYKSSSWIFDSYTKVLTRFKGFLDKIA
jgi:hypothetical protein